MLLAIILWILSAALVGHFGRHRALGFWGVFLFSLVFSPIIGILGLLVFHSSAGRSSRRTIVKTAPLAGVISSVRAGLRPAAAELLSGLSIVEGLTPNWLVITWCSLILIFAAIYGTLTAMYPPVGVNSWVASVTTGFVQSVNVGSLGAVTDPRDQVLVLISSIQRLAVLVLVIGFIARVLLETGKNARNDGLGISAFRSRRSDASESPPKTPASAAVNGG